MFVGLYNRNALGGTMWDCALRGVGKLLVLCCVFGWFSLVISYVCLLGCVWVPDFDVFS